jgi:hypothetical protein
MEAIQYLYECTSFEEGIFEPFRHRRMQVANVSLCLTEHSQCTGLYADFTGKYLVKCGCFCHSKEAEVKSQMSKKSKTYSHSVTEHVGKVSYGFDPIDIGSLSSHEKSVEEGDADQAIPRGTLWRYTTLTPQAKWNRRL